MRKMSTKNLKSNNLEFLAKWGVMSSSEEDTMKKFECPNFIENFWESSESEWNMTSHDAKKLWILFSCAGCSYNSLLSARTKNRCFSSEKTKQKKETSQKPRGTWNFARTNLKASEVFVSFTFWKCEEVNIFQKPPRGSWKVPGSKRFFRGFRSIFFVYGQIKIIKLRIKLLETNVNLFPSGIKTHKSYNRSILGHRTPDSCILHFDSFFSCFSIYFFYSIFFHFNSFLFNVTVLKYRL